MYIGGVDRPFLAGGDPENGPAFRKAARKAGVNITALDAVAAGGGRYGAILWVKPAEVRKAAKALGAK